MQGLVGNVVGRVIGRFAVVTGIHAEDGKVAGVAGPHPVVGVVAEFTDAAGGRTHKAHVGKLFVAYEEVLVAGKVVAHQVLVVVAFCGCLGDAVDVGANGFLTGFVVHVLGDSFEYAVGDVFHVAHKGDFKAGGGQFLFFGCGPKTVVEVVVFEGAEFLNLTVTAVVVGQQQALVGYHLAGAAAAKYYDGVFEARLIDAEELFGAEFEAHFVHGLDVELLEQGQQPHAFVGLRFAQVNKEQKEAQRE